MNGSLETAVLELLDKQAIYELINAYFNASDRRDYAKMKGLYHDDAIDEHGSFFQGLASDFIEQLPEIQEIGRAHV